MEPTRIATDDTTTTATVCGSLQLTTASQGGATMCEDANLAWFGDTWNMLVTALSNSGVSMELRLSRMHALNGQAQRT